MKRALAIASIVVALVAVALAYLHDPPWLASIDSGLREWETASDGTRYRWTSGHASFFVPATASAIVVPARTTFRPGDPNVLVSIAIDDRPADEFVLTDEQWQRRSLRLPPAGSRTLRRIDVRVDRLREGLRGAQLGEVVIIH